MGIRRNIGEDKMKCNVCEREFTEHERKYYKITDDTFVPYCRHCIEE